MVTYLKVISMQSRANHLFVQTGAGMSPEKGNIHRKEGVCFGLPVDSLKYEETTGRPRNDEDPTG